MKRRLNLERLESRCLLSGDAPELYPAFPDELDDGDGVDLSELPLLDWPDQLPDMRGIMWPDDIPDRGEPGPMA